MIGSTNGQGAWAILGIYVWAVLEQMHGMSAIGASFGCLFFIMLPDPKVDNWTGFTGWVLALLRKIILTTLSWGIGYSVGYAFDNKASMLMAILGGGLGATILGVFNLMIKNDADLPPWLTSTVSAVLRLKRGTDE